MRPFEGIDYSAQPEPVDPLEEARRRANSLHKTAKRAAKQAGKTGSLEDRAASIHADALYLAAWTDYQRLKREATDLSS